MRYFTLSAFSSISLKSTKSLRSRSGAAYSLAVPKSEQPTSTPNTHVSVMINILSSNLDDENVWVKLRNCVYWLILLLELIPFFAVGVFFFFLDFLMIDKSDEYQLINFITRFKSTFFLSYGLIKLIVQYVQYYRCVVFAPSANVHTCNINGPGAYMFVYPEAAALVV
jgi:hypothetical protein